jgi:hypothetical protein
MLSPLIAANKLMMTIVVGKIGFAQGLAKGNASALGVTVTVDTNCGYARITYDDVIRLTKKIE